MAAVIKVFSNAHILFQTAAQDFTHRAIDAVNKRGMFTVVLSGGNTPKAFFEILSQQPNIPWDKIKFFFADERYVPVDNPENNYYMANQYLFSKLPNIPQENIYAMPTTIFDNPKDAASNYEDILHKVFRLSDNNPFPKFDLVYLGLGDDSHTASLMPFSEIDQIIQKNPHQLTAALWVSKLNMYRLTLTPPAINHAQSIIFMVTGGNKAPAVSAVLKGKFEPQKYPAQLIDCLEGKTLWYLDQPAAVQVGI